jgi:hypothetical protein
MKLKGYFYTRSLHLLVQKIKRCLVVVVRLRSIHSAEAAVWVMGYDCSVPIDLGSVL